MADTSAVGGLGEMALVRRVLELLGTGETGTGSAYAARVGPGDDAAVVSWPGDVVLSTDSQQEGVHFRREWIEPEALGRRAIAVNASDVGAMGGEPRGFLVALTLPPDTALSWVEQLARGLRAGAGLGAGGWMGPRPIGITIRGLHRAGRSRAHRRDTGVGT